MITGGLKSHHIWGHQNWPATFTCCWDLAPFITSYTYLFWIRIMNQIIWTAKYLEQIDNISSKTKTISWQGIFLSCFNMNICWIYKPLNYEFPTYVKRFYISINISLCYMAWYGWNKYRFINRSNTVRKIIWWLLIFLCWTWIAINMKLEDEPGYWGFYLEGRLMWASGALFREKVNVIIK